MYLILFRGALVFGVGELVLQDNPLVENAAPPSGEDVAATRALVRNIRSATATPSGAGGWLETDAAELNSALRLTARFLPGLRGRVTVAGGAVRGQVSVPLPWGQGRKWLNLSGEVPPFEGPVVLRAVRVGARQMSPDLALFIARTGGNLVLGGGFGDQILQAATGMEITQDQVRFRLALDSMGKNGLMQRAFSTLRGAEMPTHARIEDYHRQIRAAMAEGRLPQQGSFLPYVRFALEAAYAGSTAETLPNEYTAAIFGLAKACGAQDFAAIVGRLAFDVAEGTGDWAASCDAVTFNDRIDSRRHFITSAALQAAGNRGFSVSVGEFKELYDTISGAGGFDFTDMAANLSGIRMSNMMMTAPRAEWPAILPLLETENDVIVPFEGIPQLMPEADFKARFGDVESPAYRAMIAMIEARIDALRLYRGR
jgi:hypothetical protein